MVSSTPVSRPRTPSNASRSPAPPSSNVPPIPEDESRLPGQRRSSFSFLRRGKSVERLNSKRSTSNGKLSKKQMKENELQQQREANSIPQQPPKIPDITRQGQIPAFSNETERPDSLAIMSNQAGSFNRGRVAPTAHSSLPHNVPIPPMPGSATGGYVDPYARTESMTNRGRYSYASSAVSTLNSPRRVRRRKDPTPFNILVIGARNSGKTSFLEFLRASLALPARKQRPVALHDHGNDVPLSRSSPSFISHYLETEMDDGERIGLTLWDSEGLDKTIVDLQLRELSSFLESKFEDTLNEEMKVVRSPGVRDTHIHCVFLVLDPLRLDANIAASQKSRDATNGDFGNGKSYLQAPSPAFISSLDEDLDLQVLRTLQGKTTVVPVISKADTVTSAHMDQLKRTVWESLKKASVDPLEVLGLDGEGDADSSDEEDDQTTPQETPQKTLHAIHSKHDSKALDERDEDNLLASNREDASITSHLDSSSSTSSGESSVKKSAVRPSSSTFPSTGAGETTAPYLPLSIISPDPIIAHEPGLGKIGRKFPWGFADPYNPEHCDFVRLKEAVFKEWRGELREASRELWYERWRTSRLNGTRMGRAQSQSVRGGQNGTRMAPNASPMAQSMAVGVAR